MRLANSIAALLHVLDYQKAANKKLARLSVKYKPHFRQVRVDQLKVGQIFAIEPDDFMARVQGRTGWAYRLEGTAQYSGFIAKPQMVLKMTELTHNEKIQMRLMAHTKVWVMVHGWRVDDE